MKNRLVGSLYVTNKNPMKQQMIESALMIDKWVSGKKEIMDFPFSQFKTIVFVTDEGESSCDIIGVLEKTISAIENIGA